MTWPNATDYNAAVQNPQLCFRDDDLRQGQAAGDLFGLPRPHSGNFADVYQIQGADGQSWAVKCFTRPVTGLQTRYQAISEHLQQAQRAFMVDFQFLEEGICIRGQWHPLVKMRWVEGFRLNEFICEHLNKPVVLERLALLWLRLAHELREAGMAHGDLQHGNVLLVPAGSGTSLSLKLIDYDGMFVPALADRPSGEYGHPNYQHPRRQPEIGYNRKMDRFSHLLIYTALRCLHVGGERLWQRYDNQENLLFREEDFLEPSESRLLRELWEMPDRQVRRLVGHLLLSSQGPLETVPRLDKLIDGSSVRPLSESDEVRIRYSLSERKRAIPPPLPSGYGPAKSRRVGTRPVVLSADATVDSVSLADTLPLLEAKTENIPPLRRSTAEIELDAQPPAEAPTLADPLVSRPAYPIWLAVLGVIALICFFVIKVMVQSSVPEKEPATTMSLQQPAVAKVEEKPPPPPVREIPQPPSPKVQQKSAPPAPVPPPASPTDHEHSATLRGEIRTVRSKDETPKSVPAPKPRDQQEKVHFRTVDHLQLAGTLYHGWKGKRGMTVLMLHDLGHNRNSLGWKRLAEALQAEGHTVLTFDFRGHGESKKVTPQFWNFTVNKYLNSYRLNTIAENQPNFLRFADLPTDYKPWLIEDIAAARNYLDLRHDEPSGPVNTFNLVVIGAGQSAALGSLWLASEGLRYNASEMGSKMLVKFSEKLSVLQAVWIGMADPLKLNPYVIHRWLEGAHEKPVVPITFIYGEDDVDASTLLSSPIRKKYGHGWVVHGARKSGQDLLDTDPQAAEQIQKYLMKTLQSMPPVNWVPRNVKSLRSLWRLELPGRKRQVRWFEAKRVGDEMLLPVPFHLLGIPIKGLAEPNFLPDEQDP